jgi:hypothetical protein
MDLSEAWAVLGKDAGQLLRGVAGLPDVQSKMEAVDGACRLADRLSKKLLGQNHPDKNPGDQQALDRYRRVLAARDTIREHTEKFRTRVQDILERKRNPPDGHIQIG